MCGIVGFFGLGDRTLLAAMNGAIAHRGPDDEGYFLTAGVGLAMRRLSIIDLAGGHQPLANASGRVTLVFNGEIYNYRELQREFLGAYAFRTHSDTEVVLHLYEALGEAAFAHLNGMFAFALWDADRETLYVVRDRLGIKPLYYALGANRLSFASELKGLLQDPEVPRDVPIDRIATYLTWQYVPGPQTILANVLKLPPGHFLKLKAGEAPAIAPYWQAPQAGGPGARAPSNPADFLAVLRAAVRRQMVADVPVGAFLSGGLDSSLVVALMAEVAGERLETFTAGFADARFDESPWAERVARHLGVRHQVVRLDATALDHLPALAYSLDEPIGDRAALPTFVLARLAREHVKVVLTGEGSDELFAGYPRYRLEGWARRFHRLPFARRARLWRSVLKLVPGAWREKLAKLLLSPPSPGARRQAWVGTFDAAQRVRLLGRELAVLPREPDADTLEAQLLLDMRTWLVDDVLMKVDKTTMAASLEARVPFLDHEVLDWALALDARDKLARGVSKAVVKQAAARLLPHDVIHRPKQAFHTPTATWFREARGRDWLGDVLLGGPSRARGWIDTGEVERLMASHAGGADRDQALWSLLMLELWAQAYLDPRPVPATAG